MPADSFFGALLVTQLALADKLGRKILKLATLIWVRGSILQCAAATEVSSSPSVPSPVSLSVSPVPSYPATNPKSLPPLSMVVWSLSNSGFFPYSSGSSDVSRRHPLLWNALPKIPSLTARSQEVCCVSPCTFDVPGRSKINLHRDDEALTVLADLHGGGDKNTEFVGLQFEEIKQEWGRRPMLVDGTLFMGFFLYFVGGLQARFGDWVSLIMRVIEGQDTATKGIIVCSYLFVRFFAVTMSPVSWTYPAKNLSTPSFFLYIYRSRTNPSSPSLSPSPSTRKPLKICGKAVSLGTASNWIFNFALAWAVPTRFRTHRLLGKPTSSLARSISQLAFTFFVPFPPDLHIMYSFPKSSLDSDQNKITLHTFIHSQHSSNNKSSNELSQ
ncbi:hypothetical protein K435DRAFT_972669 [Dendrothele bispora CBS 962.96]|uniref:Uncharacterized protein n=1 Tax=Dendrothele bispora (strain CBS 962.96) TaxID=1314807 RepID=A0A4S8KXQ9_DENBC|nr:hypothetical protein K435DRAFT_972669 [Dendrothele bispora CBS 962.96]